MWTSLLASFTLAVLVHSDIALGADGYARPLDKSHQRNVTSLAGIALTGRSVWADTDSSLNLAARQRTCNAGMHLCPDGVYCMDTGYFCCSQDNSKGCPTGGTCCSENGVLTGCASAGNACCGEHQCPTSTSKCCSGDGCAPSDSTCCGENYCVFGAKCCTEGSSRYCSGGPCCGAAIAASCGPNDQCCTDSDGDQFCAPSCNISTLGVDFSKFPGMDEIFENMCRGIALSGSASPNEIMLEYKKSKSAARANRRAAGCRGSGRLDCVKAYGEGWECDEFPFASSVQGGSLAAAMCVPGTHNAILGGSWGAMVRGQASGTKFRFKIKGFNCSQVMNTRKRNLDEFRIYDEEDEEAYARAEANRARHAIWHKLRQTGGAIIRNDTTSVVVDGPLVFGNYSEGKYALIAPLPSPDNDTFQGVMQISWTLAQGMIEKGFIIDDDGETYQTFGQTSGGTPTTSSIDIGPDGIGNAMVIGWSNDSNIDVQLTATLQSSGGSGGTSSGSSGNQNNGPSASDLGGGATSFSNTISTWVTVLSLLVGLIGYTL